jgi:hypothetical protein
MHGLHGGHNQRFVVAEAEGHVVSLQLDSEGRVLLLTALPPPEHGGGFGGVAMRPPLAPSSGDALASQEWVFVPLKDIHEYHEQQQKQAQEEQEAEKKLREGHKHHKHNKHHRHKRELDL